MNSKHVLSALVAACVVPLAAHAADHIDSPAATAEPNADITDLYAWMNEGADKVNVVLNVHHMATASSAFSPAVQYALHFNSAAGFAQPQTPNVLLCQFYRTDRIECWLGDEYVEGDPSDSEGIQSESGRLRVFAGRRDDPFFFELTGFKETVKAVVGAAPSLSFDEQGCPLLPPATQQALVTQLQRGEGGVPASNTFAGSSVLSLAFELDKTLVTAGGPVVGVWAGTHAAE
jgi:hypothetical protein